MIKKARSGLFSKNLVKEAFDHLPTGVCFLRENGLPVLCNHQMYRLVFDLTGKDLQSLSELNEALEAPERFGKVTADEGLYFFPDGNVRRFEQKTIKDSDGCGYVQIIAYDVTALCGRKSELAKKNDRLRIIRRSLTELSANVVAQTREQEILSMKMRVHDDIGASLAVAHRIIKQRQPISEAEAVVNTWSKAICLLKHMNENKSEKDEIAEVTELAAEMGLEITIKGELPSGDEARYLLATALRECVTNAVRYAEAKRLFMTVEHSENGTAAYITNDGKPPQSEIIEGGGLSMLRSRLLHAGGCMKTESRPVFRLIAEIPDKKERL